MDGHNRRINSACELYDRAQESKRSRKMPISLHCCQLDVLTQKHKCSTKAKTVIFSKQMAQSTRNSWDGGSLHAKLKVRTLKDSNVDEVTSSLIIQVKEVSHTCSTTSPPIVTQRSLIPAISQSQ